MRSCCARGPTPRRAPSAGRRIVDSPATIDFHRQIVARLGDVQRGFIARFAGETPSGLRVISVWESKADADRFFAERMGPLLAESLGPDRVVAPQVSELDVHEYALASEQPSAPSSLETVQALYAAFACRDLEGVFELLDPAIEWITPPTLPWSRGSYHGRDGMAEYFASAGEMLEDVRLEPDELLSCGERVVALGLYHGRARSTGRDFAARFAHVWTVRDRRITSLLGHEDTAAIRDAFQKSRQ
ncbi:MAG: nuclear transport factor 2 family protein [Actinomycetota bacterium]|nr:nuclear transport factor 2 family protein [Actinomycetota bacterium]